MKSGWGVLALIMAGGVQAETISHGGTTIQMEFVNIAHAGNSGDTQQFNEGGIRTFGAVGYAYRIGKYEVTADQWAAVRAADSRIGDAGAHSGLKPTGGTTWYEAAKFANWLTTGDAHTGAYRFDVNGSLTGVDRNAAVKAYGTVYVLPTEDEWHKAAYFKSNASGFTTYPTGDAVPVVNDDACYSLSQFSSSPWGVGSGSVENNGTYDMGGNQWEWIESAGDGSLDDMDEDRVIRGGAYSSRLIGLASYFRYERDPTGDDDPYYRYGMRIAAIPEPASIVMIGLVSGCAVFVRRWFVHC